MEENPCTMQLIDDMGELNSAGLKSFVEEVNLAECGLSYCVVAIIGPQGSGKSTLMNHLFNTNFAEMDAASGRSQTTKGIWLARCAGTQPCTIAMDLEGTDSSEGGEDDTAFEEQSTLFSLAITDIVLIDMWCHDIGRDAANKPLLRTVFQVMMRCLFGPRKTTLLFVIRDKTMSPFAMLEHALRETILKIWDEVPKPEAHTSAPLSEFFNVEVVALSSYEHQQERFKEEVAQLRQRFFDSVSPGELASDRRGAVPGSAFSFSAQQIWKEIKEKRDLDPPAHRVMVATVRCKEIADQKINQLMENETWLELEKAARIRPVPGFGIKLRPILAPYLSEYDKEAMEFDESVRNSTRRELLESRAWNLSSHGSLEGNEESTNSKKGDRLHRKVSNNLKSSSPTSSSVREENGKHDEAEINIQENLDSIRLMSKDELITYFNNEITKLKRNHESEVLDMTEHQFRLEGELLKERGSSLSSKKNKEIDMLRRRIPEVISKLEDTLVENEQIATSGINEESLSSLKGRHRDLPTDKGGVKCLSLQVSEAAEKTSDHSLAEAKLLLIKTENLKSAIEDAHIEALIREDALACILRGMMDQIKCMAEESQVEYNILQENFKSTFQEAVHNAERSRCDTEDLNMESIIMQDLCVVIFKEALKDAEQKLNNLNMKYIDENELRVSLQMEKIEKEKQLEVEVANKGILKQEVLFLTEEKEQLAEMALAALEKDKVQKEQYELAAQELDKLRGEACRQQKLISESIEESNATKRYLVAALEQIERQKADMGRLDQKLELEKKKIRETNEEKRKLRSVIQEKQNAVSTFETKERVLKEQLESVAVYIRGLLKAATVFERRVAQDISGKCSRLKSLRSQSHLLKQKANVLVRREILYKKRLEKKCSDLEKAEAEVNLLGDEVDTLLSLVEKIYMGLDHYSPILQHYSGITETLELVRFELIKWRHTKAA